MGAGKIGKTACFTWQIGRYMYDVVIIGGGVIGCAVARELSKNKAKIAVLEKEADVCFGTSRANSAIIHAGFDAKNGSDMARLNVRGNFMMDELAEKLDIKFKRIGAMVLCFDAENTGGLQELYDRGMKNGVPSLSIISGDEARTIEPNISPEVVSALYAKSSGIVCPFEMTYAFAENASVNGAEFHLNNEVLDIAREGGHFVVQTSAGTYETKTVVNCAGVYSDDIHNMVCDEKIEIIPRRGQYLLCDSEICDIVKHTLFQLPNKLGKGILVSPTVHGNILVGPSAENTDDKTDVDTTSEGLDLVCETAKLSVANLPRNKFITSFAGLRAINESDDFILGEKSDGFYDCAGISSPGLSSAPAIGEEIADMIKNKLGLEAKTEFIDTRKGVVKAKHLSFEDRVELVKNNPDYGNIICRCCEISEGEIIDAIHRPVGATTVDGVKLRCHAGLGRCQGGFCSPTVMEIITRERGTEKKDIDKNKKGSYFVVGKTDKG